MKVLLAFTGLVTILRLSQACPMIYMPVCGTDGVTYTNECFMRAHAHRHNLTITVASKGKCASSTEDICSLPSVTGPCRAAFSRWFYDTKTGKCSQFIYGGCDGNKNNFRTEGDCEKKCDSEKTAEYPCFRSLQKALGPAILVRGEPVPIHKNNHLPSCDHEGYFTHKQCDKFKSECWCVNRLGKEILNTRKQEKDVNCDVCSLPKVVGPCKAAFPRWFFNKASGTCEQFIYGGCQGNENNFEGQEKCHAMCLPHKLRVEKAPSRCQKELLESTRKHLLGRFTPRCNPDGSYHLIQCHPSTGFCWCSNPDGTKYPGTEVRGKPKCEKYKSLPEVTTLFAAVPAPEAEDVCSLLSVTGPCRASFPRWFYDTKTGKCSQFIYGGCDGNKNNFRTEEECEKKCDSEKTAEYPCFRSLQKALGPAILVLGEPVPIHKNSHLPSCDHEGYFSPKQCDKTTGECWCVSKLGKEILNTRKQGKDVSCDVCSLPKVVGPCRAAFPRWFFNKASGKCEQFIYGGCQGNENNFEGQDKCQAMCLPHKLRVEKAPSRCQKELLEATQKPLLGRFTPRCNPDGSYHLLQCHPSTGFCWCSNPDGTKYPGTEVRGKPECDKYKALPEVTTLFAAVPAQSKCQQELLESTQKPLLGRFTPRCNADGSYHLIQCHPSTGFCWCSNPDGTKYPGTEVRGKPECEKYKSLPVASTLFAAVPALSRCQQELLESTQKPLLGRFTPRCNPDGSYHLIQCHPSTGLCWCSNPDGTKYPGTEVRGKPECEKYKSLPEVNTLFAAVPAQSKCQQELLESTQKPLLGRFTPRCNPDGSYHLIQCHPSTGFCWCSNPDGTKYPGTEVRGKPECEKYKSLPETISLAAVPVQSKCQREALGSTRSKRALVGRFTPKCNEDGSYQLVQCHGSTGYCWCSAPDGTKFTGTDVPPGKQINCDKYKDKTVVTKKQEPLVKAAYQEKQTQNTQSSSPGSIGSSTAIIALSVLAALCVMAVVGVVLVRRRRGSGGYGKLPETTFQTTTGEKQPLVHAY